jgi:hypothetical protein
MDLRGKVKPNLVCKDLAFQVVPDCTPEVEVGEYFLSKFEDRLLKYVFLCSLKKKKCQLVSYIMLLFQLHVLHNFTQD